MKWIARLAMQWSGPPRGTLEWDMQEAYMRFSEAMRARDGSASSEAWDALGAAAVAGGSHDVLEAMQAVEETGADGYDENLTPAAVRKLSVAIYNLKYVRRP